MAESSDPSKPMNGFWCSSDCRSGIINHSKSERLIILRKWSWMASNARRRPWTWWTRRTRPFNVTVSFRRFPSLGSAITTIRPLQVSTSCWNVLSALILCILQFIRFLQVRCCFCFNSFGVCGFWSVWLCWSCGFVVREMFCLMRPLVHEMSINC